MKKQNVFACILFTIFLSACFSLKKIGTGYSVDSVRNNVVNAQQMLYLMLQTANKKINAGDNINIYPRSTNKKGELFTTDLYEWTSGFFPGSLWYVYEYTKDSVLKYNAVKWTEKLEKLQYFTEHHDLGFMMYCSYGNAYRLTGNTVYRQILINAATALCTRFNQKVGAIKSWNSFKSRHGNATYYYPVIIDNMMNLELLFFASKVSGNDFFRKVAIKHAETTMKNHFRPDFSSYHVVCYDSIMGSVLTKETAQGYADNSTWARGQAWAIYGYTMVYRETKDTRFLETARRLADYFVDNKNLPADDIPYWDFNANQQGFIPGVKSKANNVSILYRDVSAAAITSSALLELSAYVNGSLGRKYRSVALKMLTTLSSNVYLAQPDTNGNFILKHSVGNIPNGTEIDSPLVYADYYYIEALLRYNKLLKGQPLF